MQFEDPALGERRPIPDRHALVSRSGCGREELPAAREPDRARPTFNSMQVRKRITGFRVEQSHLSPGTPGACDDGLPVGGDRDRLELVLRARLVLPEPSAGGEVVLDQYAAVVAREHRPAVGTE